MKKVYCDICGRELSREEIATMRQDTAIYKLTGVQDICKLCGQVGASMNPAQMLIDAWKKARTFETAS